MYLKKKMCKIDNFIHGIDKSYFSFFKKLLYEVYLCLWDVV